jgi:hypothetical protein
MVVQVKLSLVHTVSVFRKEWRWRVSLDGGGWLTSHPSHFTPKEKASSINSIGDSVGPEPVLAFWRIQNLLPLLGIEPQVLWPLA